MLDPFNGAPPSTRQGCTVLLTLGRSIVQQGRRGPLFADADPRFRTMR
jgi:hypothetical protein